MNSTEIILFALIATGGMMIQSFVGFAGSLVAIPLFAMFMSPKEAVPTYNLVMIIVDVILVFEAREHIDWKRVSKLLIGGLIGIPIGAFGLKYLPGDTIAMVICGITLIFGILFIAKIKVPLGEGIKTQLGVGLLSGVLGGGISESGPPVVIYGLAREWNKNSFRTTLLTYFMFLAIMANISYWCLGLFSRQSLITAGCTVIPTLIGAWIGVILKNRINEKFFRYAVLTVVIAVSGIGIAKHLIH